MKKLLALFILAILVVVACEKAEPDNNKNENGKPGNKVENNTTVDTSKKGRQIWRPLLFIVIY